MIPGPQLSMLGPVRLLPVLGLLNLAPCASASGGSGGTETGNPPFRAELSYRARPR